MKKIKRYFRRLKNKFIEKAKIPYKLKINSLRGWTWCDKDHLLFESSFQILMDYIEKENPDEFIEWDHDDEHRAAWAIINYLYMWYTIERPKRHDPIDDVDAPEYKTEKIEGKDLYELIFIHKDEESEKKWKDAVKNSWDLEVLWHNEDTEMLCELAKIRQYLWT